ncbi:M56 family metallopeptidase [Mucilaginibacter sp. UYCu711]|uniref:M56 family metallopeptidase n=1 Tax=Mucilaginibacter sp. UYCu711 TaxID=3156339 RepID=UPI003D1C413B
MPELFIFLLKVNIALIIFCLGYYLVLRKLTFYTLNRVYLGLGIIFSSIYPLININDFLLRHQQIAKPVQQVVLNWKAPEQFIQQPGYWYWATIIFWFGATVFAARLLVQLFSLYKLYLNSKPVTILDHDVRVTTANISPFSFWQNIYINPDNLDAADLKSILQHEQVHVKEWHTLDILLAEISLVFYWFNPGVWLMKKAVRENIEFLTDRKILQAGIDTKAYQYSLLNVSIAATASAGITNHFNFSTLKKRIKMMNAKRSSNANLTRYAFLVPVVLICLCVFSASKAELVKNSKVAYRSITASINKLITITTPKNLNNDKPALKKVVAIDTIKPKKVTRIIVMTDSGVNKNFNYTIKTDERGDSTKNYIIKMVGGKGGEPDSYIVNGVKVTKEEFEKVAPKDLQTIDIVGGQFKALPGGTTRIRINGKESGFEPTQPRSVTFIKRDTARNFVFVTSDDLVKITGKDGTKITTSKFEYNTNEKPTTTEFTSVLIMIDGKEASEKEMKKLPVSEIEKISVNKDKDMLDKYGDKAKNGVLFITTKKAK